MFRIDQILSATQLLRNFGRIGKQLTVHPEALLITQKSGDHLVLVHARIFEGLLENSFDVERAPAQGDKS